MAETYLRGRDHKGVLINYVVPNIELHLQSMGGPLESDGETFPPVTKRVLKGGFQFTNDTQRVSQMMINVKFIRRSFESCQSVTSLTCGPQVLSIGTSFYPQRQSPHSFFLKGI